MKELKEIFIGDCYNRFTLRKVLFGVLFSIVLLTIMAVDSLSMFASFVGIFLPIALIWKLNLLNDFNSTEYLNKE